MKAMIFAAGLGTRLRPVTDKVPKAMVEVGGQPMLKIILDRCHMAGIHEVVVNVHYLPQVIENFLMTYIRPGMKVHISDESDDLLETGGGLLKAKNFFNDGQPFLIANADILTNIDIEMFMQTHIQLGGLATLAVRSRNASRKLLFDKHGKLLGRATGEGTGFELAFSGYHIVDPKIFDHITRTGKFSIMDWYIDICRQEDIFAYPHQEDIWIDVGTVAKLEEANQVFDQFKYLF